ncbi:MAG: UDP-N-acetylmuramoyl-tripeptide--D-alanyl-D-alanine ligase [Eggerthellaceae bacterium]|nr:UDP-N-acetylmuramoyl-tripeptide--D-alanyl-D-alanine ligase [Eggerthellaceae bacterium]
MRLNSKQIAAYTGGEFLVQPIDASALMNGISWDSRDIQPGWLYVALVGERVDGHDFVGAALKAGAAGALVMRAPDEPAMILAREMGAAIIEVANTESAITDLAREWRGHLKATIVGLTGSTGKTTTKNLVRDVVAAGKSVVATLANQNNELGVPKTLLNANPETEVIVVEMGMRGLGQIEELCEIVKPHWGIVTNAGECHIELLGSRENIARAKAELFEALPATLGMAFVNGMDDMADFMVEHARLSERHCTTVCCDGSGNYRALNASAEEAASWRARPAVWAEDISLDDQGRPHFTLCCRGFAEGWPSDAEDSRTFRQEVQLGLRGMHNVSNACQAAAVGLALHLSLETIASALAASVPESGRQEVVEARGGFTIINDAYNANPDSMRASLATFSSLAVKGKRYAVLGDMGELGDFAPACHRGVGEYAAGKDIDLLICVGELSAHIAEGALAAGMSADKVCHVPAVPDVLRELDVLLEPGDAVLVKASHFMELTRIVEGLVN